jgi:hypothetical protein
MVRLPAHPTSHLSPKHPPHPPQQGNPPPPPPRTHTHTHTHTHARALCSTRRHACDRALCSRAEAFDAMRCPEGAPGSGAVAVGNPQTAEFEVRRLGVACGVACGAWRVACGAWRAACGVAAAVTCVAPRCTPRCGAPPLPHTHTRRHAHAHNAHTHIHMHANTHTHTHTRQTRARPGVPHQPAALGAQDAGGQPRRAAARAPV